MGKRVIEEKIQEETLYLIEEFQCFNGKVH